jgi:hypothetical protein
MISGASEEELELANVIADKLLLQKESQELKKQLEEYKKELETADNLTQICIFKGKEESKISYRKCLNILDKKEIQQKEFIKYLEDKKISPIKCVLNSIDDKNHDYNMFKNKLDNYEEILQKYREIIGE